MANYALVAFELVLIAITATLVAAISGVVTFMLAAPQGSIGNEGLVLFQWGVLVVTYLGFAPIAITGAIMSFLARRAAPMRAPALWAAVGLLGGFLTMLLFTQLQFGFEVIVGALVTGLVAALAFRALGSGLITREFPV